MTNYSNGKIYKIEPLNGEDGDIYIGSTTKEYLSQRMTAHRTNYKQYLNGKTGNVTSFNLFNKYGVGNCNIILLELVNANSKDELHAREAHYIKSLSCINKVVPLQTPKEYYEANRDAILTQKKIYNVLNRDAIHAQKKIYDDANKNKVKQFRDANKDAINQRRRELRRLKKQQLTA